MCAPPNRIPPAAQLEFTDGSVAFETENLASEAADLACLAEELEKRLDAVLTTDRPSDPTKACERAMPLPACGLAVRLRDVRHAVGGTRGVLSGIINRLAIR